MDYDGRLAPIDIVDCLSLSFGEHIEQSQRRYLGNILHEAFLENVDSQVIWELIEPFVEGLSAEQCKVATDSFIKHIERVGETTEVESRNEDPVSDLLITVPITLMELINGVPIDREVVSPSDASMMMKKKGHLEDAFLGLENLQVNLNDLASTAAVISEHKAKARAREKQLQLMKEWTKERPPLPLPKRKHGDSQVNKITDIVVPTFSVAVGGRELLKNAQLKLVVGKRYGLIGRNGIGKTTFLNALVRGEINGVDPSVSVGCVEQEFTAPDEWTPFDAVIKIDEERFALLEEEEALSSQSNPTPEVGIRLAQIYARLEDIQADKMESLAASILSGLGFSEFMMRTQKLGELSGGWKMRVMLARVLFSDPDILCLDEPTNHLDLHAVAWLANFLRNSGKTIIVVSHSRNFLNEICTDILEFRDQVLKYFTGDYDSFEKQKAERLKVLNKQIESQQAKVEHTQRFIDRFRQNAKRAALVQSRIKALQKLPLLEQVTSDPTLKFQFLEPEEIPTPILVIQEVSFSFSKGHPVLRKVDLTVDLDSRVAVCGLNGSGKSTLLKLLIGQLETMDGQVIRHNKLRIGYFAQHHVDTLELTMNAVQQLQARYPEANLSIEAARSYLGKFGISGTLSLEPLFILSGGQKSRVAIALMAFSCPHILVLDEPTNHLDLEAVQALIAALNEFRGGVVLVSHDAHLLDCVVDDVFHLDSKTHELEHFKGSFSEYRKQLLKNRK